MNLSKRLLSMTAVGALSAGLLVTIGSGAAQAAFPATPGQLTISPATGTESTGAAATLSEPCPAGSTGLVGYLSGPGVTEAQGVIQSFRPANTTSFQLSGIFKDAFQNASLAAPSGAFTVRIACIGADSFTEVGSFTQTVNFVPRAGTNNATYATVVPAAATTTTLAQNNASGAFGSSVTFTADATDGVAGSVQFKDGAADLGTPQAVNATGIAAFTTSSLTVGTHPVTAVFTPTNTVASAPSTSSIVSHDVTAITTGLGLISNGPTAQYSGAVFTATVSPATAGTVTFSEGATVLGTGTVNAGVATFSSTGLSVGTHSVTAHYTPAAGTGALASDSTAAVHVVTSFAGVTMTQSVIVTVPAGGLVMALDDGADGIVNLGAAAINAGGDLLTASGQMDRVKITDTRAGDPGWTASGIVDNFVNGADRINGYNLGWVPNVVSSSVNQVGIAAGLPVTAGTEGSPTATPSNAATGLKSSRVLAVAQDDAGNGTAVLGALLNLNVPTDVPAGDYAATLTFTVS